MEMMKLHRSNLVIVWIGIGAMTALSLLASGGNFLWALNGVICIEEAKQHLREKARPDLVSYPDSIDGYDTVILAYPNYCGTIPMVVATFLERYDFTGKTILPLCTNEGSGMGGSEKTIKQCAPGGDVKKGLSVNGSNAANSGDDVRRWLKVNGLI